LDAAASERLGDVLQEELERAFERARQAGGGVHRLYEEVPSARAAFEALLEFLTPEQRAKVSAALDRRLAGG
jgi:hypothetical protein